MVGWLNILMDGWMDGRRSNIGFFLDILHVRKVAKKILFFFSKYSTSSHSCLRRDRRTDEWTDGQTENTDVLTDRRTYGRTTDRRIDR